MQRLQWDLESGQWAVVVMNADGSRGVGADASVGVKSDWVLPVGLGLLGGFAFLSILGTVLLVLGVVGLGRRVHAPPITGPHPVRVSGRFDPQLSRWLWIVKVILLIPHFIVLAVLWLAFAVVTVIAGFAILFTGRYPRSLFDFNAGRAAVDVARLVLLLRRVRHRPLPAVHARRRSRLPGAARGGATRSACRAASCS